MTQHTQSREAQNRPTVDNQLPPSQGYPDTGPEQLLLSDSSPGMFP